MNDSPSDNVAYCGHCELHQYDKARAIGVYEAALKDSVVGLKTVPYMSGRLRSELLTAFVRNGFDSSELIVPIPLSKKRLIERGHNQAAAVGRVIASGLSIEFDGAALERSRDTPMHRAGMDRKAREITVKKAFNVIHPRIVAGRRITLIDDVFTTGTTAAVCAKELKKSGACEVSVFTIARAVQF